MATDYSDGIANAVSSQVLGTVIPYFWALGVMKVVGPHLQKALGRADKDGVPALVGTDVTFWRELRKQIIEEAGGNGAAYWSSGGVLGRPLDPPAMFRGVPGYGEWFAAKASAQRVNVAFAMFTKHDDEPRAVEFAAAINAYNAAGYPIPNKVRDALELGVAQVGTSDPSPSVEPDSLARPEVVDHVTEPQRAPSSSATRPAMSSGTASASTPSGGIVAAQLSFGGAPASEQHGRGSGVGTWLVLAALAALLWLLAAR